jgi:KUP system potassium uptake protein
VQKSSQTNSENQDGNETGNLPEEAEGRRLAVLSLAALGVVFGDIGTSPLYALRECFYGEYGIAVTRANLLGVLSLMLWSLILVVSVKYLSFILRADNRGEGGVIALTALLHPRGRRRGKGRWKLVALGLFAASLLYGDGMITPAISVLSAVEGLRIITPAFEPWVLPVTVGILAGLFLIQHRGTEGVGALFGPVILVWLTVLGALGMVSIVGRPEVLAAVNPLHGLEFLAGNGRHGFLVLGAVFLVVTGAEALYADMGHFGRRPIRLTWFALVLPALVLNYFGQGAVLLARPEEAHHPFYALVPTWGRIPMVLLATSATIIASQAVISGAFSLTRQAIQLGYLPRLKVIHTSSERIGQIYVPLVNRVLAAATIGLVLGFRSSSQLAAAYGVAVTTTMLISTVLFYVVARECWGWSRLAAMAPAGLFLVVDVSFFLANISKIAHGAWFPLVVAAVAFALMTTWQKGRALLRKRFHAYAVSMEELVERLAADPPQRVPGKAVFLTGSPEGVPAALLQNIKHNRVVHEETAFLHVITEEVPRVPAKEKLEVEDLGDGFYSVIAHYGYLEDPHVPRILKLAAKQDLDFPLKETSFFLGRERLLPSKKVGMSLWRSRLFAFMSRNALGATAFYHIPPGQVLEVGAQLRV